MSWDDFLGYASGPGINALVGAVLALVVEYWPRYGELEARWKRLVIFVLCLAVPLVATAAGVVTADWTASWEGAMWPALVAGFTAYVASQAVHARGLVNDEG